EFAGNFNAIVFSPTDLSLIIDGPSVRRRFLDIAIGQLYPRYIEILKKYNRAVMQRNNILKDCIRDASLKFLLDDYEEVIIECGEIIIDYRKKYIEKIKQTAPKIYEGISQKKEVLEIEYLCSSENKGLREKLKISRQEDMYKGVTSVGPHRDDIIFKINAINCRDFGSQGQKRSVALALKLSEAEIIKEITGEQPIALLDDVMSELDKSRQDYILNHIDGWQVFITCCETGHFENLNEGKIFTVKNGEIF
ncbi:MAG: DNA replication and repair protein RecF, partial [Clostridia bacterium]|nr:DNA replication and repair protein RecF [Clostridia bacterium]